jgi:hypothetical protein
MGFEQPNPLLRQNIHYADKFVLLFFICWIRKQSKHRFMHYRMRKHTAMLFKSPMETGALNVMEAITKFGTRAGLCFHFLGTSIRQLF